MLKIFSVILVSLCSIFSQAYALDLSVLGNMSYSNYLLNTTPAPVSSPGLVGFGFGATATIDFTSHLGLEGGALYVSHPFATNVYNSSINTVVNTNYNYNFFQIPLFLKISPISILSVNFGGYYGIATSTSASSSNAGSTSVVAPPLVNDYGLIGGVGVRIPVLPLLKIRGDIMYEYGLAILSKTADSSQYTRSLDFWAGVVLSL